MKFSWLPSDHARALKQLLKSRVRRLWKRNIHPNNAKKDELRIDLIHEPNPMLHVVYTDQDDEICIEYREVSSTRIGANKSGSFAVSVPFFLSLLEMEQVQAEISDNIMSYRLSKDGCEIHGAVEVSRDVMPNNPSVTMLPDFIVSHHVSNHILCDMIRNTVWASGFYADFPGSEYLNFEIHPDDLVIGSTNGCMAAMISRGKSETIPDRDTMLSEFRLRNFSCQTLLTLLGKLHFDTYVRIINDRERIVFVADHFQISFPNHKTDYPKLRSCLALPKAEKTASFMIHDMREALKLIDANRSDKNKHETVLISPMPDGNYVLDSSNLQIKVRAGKSGGTLDVPLAFNHEYLLDAVENYPDIHGESGGAVIEMEFNEFGFAFMSPIPCYRIAVCSIDNPFRYKRSWCQAPVLQES